MDLKLKKRIRKDQVCELRQKVVSYVNHSFPSQVVKRIIKHNYKVQKMNSVYIEIMNEVEIFIET